MPAIVKVTEIEHRYRERNRNAGNSYGAQTMEIHYVAHFDDGSTERCEYLPNEWKPFLEKRGA